MGPESREAQKSWLSGHYKHSSTITYLTCLLAQSCHPSSVTRRAAPRIKHIETSISIMLRSTRPLLTGPVRGFSRPMVSIAPLKIAPAQRSSSSTPWRAQRPNTVSSKHLVPYIQQAKYASKTGRDEALEKELAKKKLESDPEHVTAESSVRHLEGPGTRPAEGSTTEGLKGDVVSLTQCSGFPRNMY